MICDAVFGVTKRRLNFCEAFTPKQAREAMDMPKSVERTVAANEVTWNHWKPFLETISNVQIPNISACHHICFSKDHPGHVLYKFNAPSTWKKIQIIPNDKIEEVQNLAPPTALLPAPPMKAKRQKQIDQVLKHFYIGQRDDLVPAFSEP